MKDCKFTFLGLSFSSYTELFNFIEELISKNDIILSDDLTDIVFSKSTKQDRQFQNIEKLKKGYFVKKKASPPTVESIISGEPDIGDYSIINFLDSDLCSRLDGTKFITPMNREDYIKALSEHLVEKLGMSKEDAEKEVKEEVALWELHQNCSFEIHLLFSDLSIYAPEKHKDEAIEQFLERADSILETTKMQLKVLRGLYNQLSYSYMYEKGKYANSKASHNINISHKLEKIGREINGHIGHIFIGEDGVLHLQLYKTTLDNPEKWSDTKLNKYKYQAAFLLAMLAAESNDPETQIAIKNATVDIIPVQLKYNKENKEIIDTKVHASIRITSNIFGNYALNKYQKDVKSFIKYNNVSYFVSSDPILQAQKNAQAIFPEINIREDGIETSAYNWIKYAPNDDPNNNEPLVIRVNDNPEYAYEVIINGHKYNIKERREKEHNKEIFNLVNAHVRDLESNKTYITQSLKDAIKLSYVAGFGTFDKIKGLRGISESLKRALSKYLYYVKDETTGLKHYQWELLDNLSDCNVLLFKHKTTGVIDVISLSTYPLNDSAALKLGTNILGHYKVNGEYNKLAGTYGNIQAVTTMELINQIIPELGENVTLGTLGVMSVAGKVQYRTYHIGEFNKNYYSDIRKVVNSNNPDIDIKNNFSLVLFSDPFQSLVDEYLQITDVKHPELATRLDALGFSDLEEAETRELKAYALLNIMQQILVEHSDFADYNKLKDSLNPINGKKTQVNYLAQLYKMASEAYLYITGESPTYTETLSSVDLNLLTAPTVPDPNIRIVVNNMQITHDTISSEFLDIYEKDIRKLFDQFYKDSGYTHAQNMTLGNLAQQYNNLFERDSLGNNLYIFKNPYDTSNDLKPHERTLLKHVLLQIAQIHSNYNFKIKDVNDPRIVDYIKQHPEYLWVPLEKASNATSRQSGEAWVAKMKNFWKRVTHPQESFDLFAQGVDPIEKRALGKDSEEFYALTLKNPFDASMVHHNCKYSEARANRLKLIAEYGNGYFETNIENLLIDFLFRHISTTQLNKFLVTSKALLILLLVTGNMAGNESIVEKEVKYILDYLRVNVFKGSIMDETSRKIFGVIYPAKHIVTNMLLGGNVISAFRDTFEGLQQTFMRSVIKFNTDISPANLSKAYAYVWRHSTSDAMAVNLLSKLCLKYRLSNTDVGRITERAKSGRNGIFNYDNWMYSTLRSPDFLNRMTLFVARCMEDGSWSAWSIDENDNLKYDWTKDKRFEVFAKKMTTHKDYAKQKALYYSCIRAYNEDNPGKPIAYTEDLPLPYSNKEINNIRNAGDNIFGSYDKGKKSMGENYAIGVAYGMFTTWMNGIFNNYFMKPQENGVTKFKLEQETNENGEPLFFNEDGSVTTSDTGLIVYKLVPVLVQGIMYTVLDAVRLVRLDSWASMANYLKSNPVAKANMRKLISDLLMWVLLGLIFKFAITPAYQEYKKTDMKNNPVLLNLAVEIIYKSSSRSYDQFKGLINIIDFFGSNNNSAWYDVPKTVVGQAYEALVGEKSWKYLMFDNLGITRTFRDTGMTLWKQAQQ